MAAPGSVTNGGVVGTTTGGFAISEVDSTFGGTEVATFSVDETVVDLPIDGTVVPDNTYAYVGTAFDPAGDAASVFYSQISGSYFIPGLDPMPTTGATVSGNPGGTYPDDIITNFVDGSSASYDYATQTESLTPCFCRGTLIATPRGHATIESLSIGHLVLTTNGEERPIKWIGRRSYSARFAGGRRDLLPVLIKVNAFGDMLPSRDLLISPLHSVFVDNLLIPVVLLINGRSISQPSTATDIEYYHIELDSHDVILAENLPVETFLDEGNRGMFQNGHDAPANATEMRSLAQRSYAPRVEDGPEVELVRVRLGSAAGLEILALEVGPMRGAVDAVKGGIVTGWAQNVDHPEVPVCLNVLVDGRVVTQVLANHLRIDLASSGLGSGRHGFQAELPSTVVGSNINCVTVCRAMDGCVLGSVASCEAA